MLGKIKVFLGLLLVSSSIIALDSGGNSGESSSYDSYARVQELIDGGISLEELENMQLPIDLNDFRIRVMTLERELENLEVLINSRTNTLNDLISINSDFISELEDRIEKLEAKKGG